jgi:hypothetical protein
MKLLLIMSMLSLTACAAFQSKEEPELGNRLRQEKTECIRKFLNDNVNSGSSVELCEWVFKRFGE